MRLSMKFLSLFFLGLICVSMSFSQIVYYPYKNKLSTEPLYEILENPNSDE